MARPYESALNLLRQSCELHDARDAENYLSAIGELSQFTDAELLREMLLCLRDADAGDLQYALVEACERYPIDTYGPVFVDVSGTVAAVSPWWFRLMVQSLFNTEEDWPGLISALRKSSADKRAFMRDLVGKLAAGNAKYARLLTRLPE